MSHHILTPEQCELMIQKKLCMICGKEKRPDRLACIHCIYRAVEKMPETKLLKEGMFKWIDEKLIEQYNPDFLPDRQNGH